MSWITATLVVGVFRASMVLSVASCHVASTVCGLPATGTSDVRLAIRTTDGCSRLISSIDLARNALQSVFTLLVVTFHTLTSSAGQPGRQRRTSRILAARATGAIAGSHMCACESPNRTTVRFDVTSPKTHCAMRVQLYFAAG